MSESVLSSSLLRLTNLSSLIDSWFNVFTFLVVVGVALEIIVVRMEYRHDWREFLDHLRGLVRAPGRPNRLKFVLEILGAILVAGGVTGEFFVHIWSEQIETEIRVINRDLLGIANTRAQNALDRAIKEADARAELAKQLLWYGPRDVPLLTAQEQIDAALKPFVGQRFRDSICRGDFSNGNLGASEAATAENGLMRVLVHAGWSLVPSRGIPKRIPFPLILPSCESNGIWAAVRPSAPKSTKEAAATLAALLRDVLREQKTASVLTSDIHVPNQLPADVIEIRVGRHLEHPFDAR